MDEAFSFFSTSKDDLSITKFNFDHFNEPDSGFLSDFTTPDKSHGNDSTSTNKIVTFREPPEKVVKINHEEPKSSNHLFSDKNKSAPDFSEHLKLSTESNEPKSSDAELDVDVVPSKMQVGSEESMEVYFKSLLGEVSSEMCQQPLKKLLELEKFENASMHILDDLLKEAKKLEGKLVKEKMALKKRVERLMNSFNA